jgi:hypothetical protein
MRVKILFYTLRGPHPPRINFCPDAGQGVCLIILRGRKGYTRTGNSFLKGEHVCGPLFRSKAYTGELRYTHYSRENVPLNKIIKCRVLMIYRRETVLQIKIQELANLFLTVGSGTYCQMSDTVNCRLESFIPSILVNISPSSSESGSISQSNKNTMRLQIFIRNTGFYYAFPHFIYVQLL